MTPHEERLIAARVRGNKLYEETKISFKLMNRNRSTQKNIQDNNGYTYTNYTSTEKSITGNGGGIAPSPVSGELGHGTFSYEDQFPSYMCVSLDDNNYTG